ncbi:hypothetical protein KDW_45190 [Dictyobacter vulcani]|uniref:Leucine-binding protein domain-containing protein n=1 Tax=Dictyobacter vulcani TaxID=2607529 RepID=A0A5J4KV24_9CHLR|nr:ABC transporter substrate-binding protein [Dictyobacter vulcani]GER90357.1 hypothetical protein KDW_45190 [Dictyobacter vulcani]
MSEKPSTPTTKNLASSDPIDAQPETNEAASDTYPGDGWSLNILWALTIGIFIFSFFTSAYQYTWSSVAAFLAIEGFKRVWDGIFKYTDRLLYQLFSQVPDFVQKIWHWLTRVYILSTPFVIITLVFMLLTPKEFSSFFSYLYPNQLCIEHQIAVLNSVCPDGVGTSQMQVGNEQVTVGIIDENQNAPFDQSNGNASEKQLETMIFQENKKAMASKPYVTLMVATMLSRTLDDNELSISVGLKDLSGAYLAQKDYNAKHKLKVRLVIANIGTRLAIDQTVALVMKQIVLYARKEPSFRGMIGLPFSGSTQRALRQLADLHQSDIPVVSPSATSDLLSDMPNFYRVVSSDKVQSKFMAQFFAKHMVPAYRLQMHLKPSDPLNIAVFSDSTDPYSTSLNRDFLEQAQGQIPNLHPILEQYIVGRIDTINQSVQDALTQGARMIYFSGYQDDLLPLESVLQELKSRMGIKQTIPIMGGDGLYEMNSFQHNDYESVFATVYASPIDPNSAFKKEFDQTFGETADVLPNQPYVLLAPHAILSYDATNAFLHALDKSMSINGNGELPSVSDFNSALQNVTFEGVSGLLSFEGGNTTSLQRSDPLNKGVYVMCVDINHHVHTAASYGPDQSEQYLLKDSLKCLP